MTRDADGAPTDTNMEFLLYDDARSGEWTAPRWMTAGDILFFYHTKRSRARIRKVAREALAHTHGDTERMTFQERLLYELLLDQMSIADRYGGTIFACARVTGRSHMDSSNDDGSLHWGSRIYAPFEELFVFAEPLPDRIFSEHVTLSPGGTLTPVHGAAFLGLRTLLAEQGPIPDYLAAARPGGRSFRDVDSSNWPEIIASPQTTFIDESQLRAYYADYLLDAIRDPGTRVFRECRCEQPDGRIGIADYFVRIGGTWVPVETKLNVLAERDLPAQVAKYCGVTGFVPRQGRHRSPQLAAGSPLALVIDSAGVYLVSSHGFEGCTPERPLLARPKLSGSSVARLRGRLARAIST